MKHVDICLEDGQYPNIKYHETCRYMFTLKRDLQKIQDEKEASLNCSTSSTSDSRNKRQIRNRNTVIT